MIPDDSSKVLKHLEQQQTISPEHEQGFLADLVAAVQIQNTLSDIPRAPYIDPSLTGEVRAEVRFPGYTEYTGSSFSLIVRPRVGEASSALWYGVPMWLGAELPYEKSGLAERHLSALRLDRKLDPATDSLCKIIAGNHKGELRRANQDLLVDMTIGDIISAYQTEDGTIFKDIRVQQVKAVVPTNPAYTTEGAGFVSNVMFRPHEHVCFGYSLGETFYRGRPILSNSAKGPRLTDIDASGEQSFFNLEARSSLRGKDEVKDIKAGNMVVIALPLIGEAPASPAHPWQRDNERTLGMSRGGTFGLDDAVFSTGRRTGVTSKYMAGKFDPERPVSILDVQVLALTPEKIPNALRGLPQ